MRPIRPRAFPCAIHFTTVVILTLTSLTGPIPVAAALPAPPMAKSQDTFRGHRADHAMQAQSPTPAATITGSEASGLIATADLSGTPPASETALPIGTPEPGMTPTPSASLTAGTPTPGAGGTPTPPKPVALQFNFAVSPERAVPGDLVMFTVMITNKDEKPATNVAFANTLPKELDASPAGFGLLTFDPATRALSWSSKEIAPGETVQLQYSVSVAVQATEPLLVTDAAALTADGLGAPLAAKTSLVVAPAGEPLAAVGPAGGRQTAWPGG